MQESFVDNQAQGSVVDRLRGAVGTWFGLSGDPQSQTPQQSHGNYMRLFFLKRIVSCSFCTLHMHSFHNLTHNAHNFT